MKPRALAATAALAAILGLPAAAVAGMPSVTLTDLTRMRVQTISFFLLVFLACAGVVRRIWNGLRGDFPRLPRLSYRRAVGLVALWGLLFLLVLTMISGARELMTPGAWEKRGLTFALADASKPEPAPADDPLDEARRLGLERLRAALWKYAEAHDGRFPPDADGAGLPDGIWQVPDPSGLRYLYVAGRRADEGGTPLAFEPGLFGPDRYVLRADGAIRRMGLAEIKRALPPEAR